MPRPKQVKRPAPAPSTDPAAALIQTVKHGITRGLPSQNGLVALKRLIEHNDSEAAPTKKVGAESAIQMLRDHYEWRGQSISALNTVCRRAFGRKSWGTP